MNHLKLLSVFGSVYGFELHPHLQSTVSEESYKNVMLGSARRFNNVKLYVIVKLHDTYYLSSFLVFLPSSSKQVCRSLQEIRLVFQGLKFTDTFATTTSFFFFFCMCVISFFCVVGEIICSVTVGDLKNELAYCFLANFASVWRITAIFAFFQSDGMT